MEELCLETMGQRGLYLGGDSDLALDLALGEDERLHEHELLVEELEYTREDTRLRSGEDLVGTLHGGLLSGQEKSRHRFRVWRLRAAGSLASKARHGC